MTSQVIAIVALAAVLLILVAALFWLAKENKILRDQVDSLVAARTAQAELAEKYQTESERVQRDAMELLLALRCQPDSETLSVECVNGLCIVSHKVPSKSWNVVIPIKVFDDPDAEFNRVCAEELLEHLTA